MKEVSKDRIAPHSGVAFELKRGQLLKVIDPEGQQVSEMLCYNLGDPDEWLSSGRTLDHIRAWQVKEGDILYSNRSNPMLSLVEDTCGRHDFLMAPCSRQTFDIHSEHEVTHSSCHENLFSSLMGWDIEPDEIHTTFSIFMNAQPLPDGDMKITAPLSKAGDYIIFRAEMDMVVGLTACASADYTNGNSKPIDYIILED